MEDTYAIEIELRRWRELKRRSWAKHEAGTAFVRDNFKSFISWVVATAWSVGRTHSSEDATFDFQYNEKDNTLWFKREPALKTYARDRGMSIYEVRRLKSMWVDGVRPRWALGPEVRSFADTSRYLHGIDVALAFEDGAYDADSLADVFPEGVTYLADTRALLTGPQAAAIRKKRRALLEQKAYIKWCEERGVEPELPDEKE